MSGFDRCASADVGIAALKRYQRAWLRRAGKRRYRAACPESGAQTPAEKGTGETGSPRYAGNACYTRNAHTSGQHSSTRHAGSRSPCASGTGNPCANGNPGPDPCRAFGNWRAVRPRHARHYGGRSFAYLANGVVAVAIVTL